MKKMKKMKKKNSEIILKKIIRIAFKGNALYIYKFIYY